MSRRLWFLRFFTESKRKQKKKKEEKEYILIKERLNVSDRNHHVICYNIILYENELN